MSYYKALVVDDAGNKTCITDNAISQETFEQKLSEKGYYLIKIKEISDTGAHGSIRHKGEFTIELVYQIASLIDFGLDVNEVFKILCRIYTKGVSGRFVTDVYEYLGNGESFYQAIKHGDRYGVFNDFVYTMIRAGENGGKLGYSFSLIYNYLISMKKIKDKIISASVYPVILFIMALVALNALFLFIIPNFKQVYTNMDLTPPVLINMLFILSDFVVNYYFVLITLCVACIVGIVIAFTKKSWRMKFAQILWFIPVISTVMRLRTKIKLAFCMEVLLKGGSSLEEAVYQLIRIETDGKIVKQLESVYESLKEGRGMKQAFSDISLFTEKDLSIVEIAEAVSKTADGFERINNDTGRTLEQYTDTLLKLLEPVLMIGIGFFVFLVMYLVISPTLEMLSKY